MNIRKQLPLYLGIGIFIFAVLLSAIKVGQNAILTNTRSQAGVTTALLSLQYISPNQINVLINSSTALSGVDITIRFPSEQMRVLPSTLIGSALFDVTGGNVDDGSGVLTFSGIAKKDNVTSGVLASFQIEPIHPGTRADVSIDEQNSALISASSKQNILNSVKGVSIPLE